MLKGPVILQRIIRFALVGCVVTHENILESLHDKKKSQEAPHS